MRDTHEVHDHDDLDNARKSAPVVALFGADDDDESEAVDGPGGTVDDLFARLRAARAEQVVERAISRVRRRQTDDSRPTSRPTPMPATQPTRPCR